MRWEASRVLRFKVPRSIREEIAAARYLQEILRGADAWYCVQTGIESAADEAFAPHASEDGRDGDGGAKNRYRSRETS